MTGESIQRIYNGESDGKYPQVILLGNNVNHQKPSNEILMGHYPISNNGDISLGYNGNMIPVVKMSVATC
jgi:hypothetical protein